MEPAEFENKTVSDLEKLKFVLDADGNVAVRALGAGEKGDQGDQGEKGDQGMSWQGAYDNSTTYAVDDAVSYNGSSYICIQASTGNLPTDTDYWDLIAAKGDTGATGSQGDQGVQGDMVYVSQFDTSALALSVSIYTENVTTLSLFIDNLDFGGITDNFDDNTFNDTLWTASDVANVEEQNQRLELNTETGGWGAMYSNNTINLAENSCSLEVVDIDGTLDALDSVTIMELDSQGNDTTLGFYYNAGQIETAIQSSDVYDFRSFTYSAATHKWFRIRQTDRVIYWETSADNSTWTEQYRAYIEAGAGVSLNNLASVAINTSLVSDTDSTDDLGSSANYWANTYTDTLHTRTINASELSADPADPAEGNYCIWMSDGTGAGDDGDIMIKITAGGVTKTATLVDFSAI